MLYKICIKCKAIKIETEFYKSHTCKDKLDTICKCCKKEYAIKWRQTDNAKLANKKSKVKLKTYDLWYFAKLRAKRKGIVFNIKIEDIVIPEVCPILGIPLIKDGIKQNDNSPSIDRIDNLKGYTKDNIRIVSWRANNIKGIGSIDDHIKLVDYMINPLPPELYYNRDVAKERLLRLYYDATNRSKKNKLEFNIEKSDIMIPLICPALNIPIKIDNNKLSYDSPTLDRIDNSKGYVKGNICVISWKANKIKSYGSLEDHKKIIDYLTSQAT